MKPMAFSIATLGCKSNQFESQAMAKLLKERGHTEKELGNPVDAYIINTCSVTAVSDKKSRQLIRKLQKEHPNTIIAVCGCYAQVSPEEIQSLSVNLVGGTANHSLFIQELESLWQQTSPQNITLPQDDPRKREHIEPLPSGGIEGRTRALLKIQDGCENFCTYCIIPKTRGKIRSLSPTDAALAIHQLIKDDFSEIVLTGIEISSWGKEFPKEPKKQNESLSTFLETADTIAQSYKESQGKDTFFRLGSLEPRTITEEFCSTTKNLPSLRPHFHLSLQSGSDTVLKRMNRKYSTERFFQSVTLLRQHFQNPAITTDLIVGFPGESEEEFKETLAFLEKCQFSSVHIFPYSKRADTPAAKMPNQITNEIKSLRSKEASSLTKQHQKNYQKQFLGKTLPILLESEQNGTWTGNSPHYIQVTTNSTENLQNQTKQVKITAQTETGLHGILE